MRSVLILCIAGVIGLQCGVPENRSEARPADPDRPTRSVLSADTLRPGRPLTLRLGRPHPQGLAIADPDDRYFFLQKIGDTQLMDSAAFANLRELGIPADLKGLYFDDGTPGTYPVFTKSGKYTVYLADDLETEPENTNAESLELWFDGKR